MAAESETPALDTELSQEECETWIERIRDAGPVPPHRGGDLAGGPLAADAVPGFSLLGEIGRGGQAVVYRALQVATRRVVALKLLREGPLASEALRRRFMREVELAASLAHTGIVTIHEAGETPEGRPFLVMEHIRGRRLDRHVAANDLSFEGRVRLIVAVCEAVQHAHRRGVIHLDLKPSNVLVDESGTVKVLDFGLARTLGHDDPTVTVTQGLAAGTPAYMAPEQTRESRSSWDTRTDGYALGVLLFETVTGRLPYTLDGGPLEVMRTVAEAAPARPSDLLPASSGAADTNRLRDLDAIVAKALAKDPDERFSSASDLAADLRALLAGGSVSARQHERGYRVRQLVRQHAGLFGGLAATIVVLAGLAFLFGTMSREQARLREVADQRALRAERAEALERERFDQVRHLAHTFIHEFDPLIRFLPGAAPARERIVSEGLAYLDALAQTATDDVEMTLEMADAYVVIGDVLHGSNTSNLGRSDAAAESYRSALEAVERAGGADASAQHADLHYRAMIRLSDMLRVLGENEEASRLVGELYDGVRARMEADPEDLVAMRDLGRVLDRVGLAALERGETAVALERYREAQEIFERLVDDDPDDLTLRRDLAVGYTKLAEIQRANGRLEEALALYERFRDEAEKVSEADPNAVYAQGDVATGYEWTGRVLADLGRPGEALEPLRRARAQVEEVLALDPDVLERRIQLASITNRLGEALMATDALEDAATEFARFLAQAEDLRDTHPSVPRTHRLLGVAHHKLHEVHLALAEGDAVDAEERARNLRAALESLRASREIFVEMDRTGILAPGDAVVPMTLALKIAALESRLASSGG